MLFLDISREIKSKTTVAKETKKKSPLGSGKSFKKLASDLKKKGAKDPKALAAYIGRKKYGKKKFAALGRKGKRKG